MSKPTKIPPSEWEIMEVLWGESPLSAAEIFERMGAATSWSVKTVRAFLDRLLQKEAVSRRKIHGMYVFEPVVRRSDCLRQESQSFLDRFFQGKAISMIAHFLDEERLGAADVERLRGLLAERSTGVPSSTGVPPVSERDAGVPPARGMGVPPMSGTGVPPVRLEGFQPSRTLDNSQDSPSGTSTATGGTPMPRSDAGGTPARRETPMPREGTP